MNATTTPTSTFTLDQAKALDQPFASYDSVEATELERAIVDALLHNLGFHDTMALISAALNGAASGYPNGALSDEETSDLTSLLVFACATGALAQSPLSEPLVRDADD